MIILMIIIMMIIMIMITRTLGASFTHMLSVSLPFETSEGRQAEITHSIQIMD